MTIFEQQQIIDMISQSGWIGLFLYGLACFLQAIFPYVPLVALASAGVLLFGFKLGFFMCWMFSSLGATALFFIARYTAYDWAERKVGHLDLVRKFNNYAKSHGFQIVFVARLVGFVPSSITTIAAAVSAIEIPSFIFATWLAKFPMSFVEAWFGHSIIHFNDEGKYTLPVILCIGLIYFLWKRHHKNQVATKQDAHL